jgi:hypothetical protein
MAQGHSEGSFLPNCRRLCRERHGSRSTERLRQQGEHHKVGVKLDASSFMSAAAGLFLDAPPRVFNGDVIATLDPESRQN